MAKILDFNRYKSLRPKTRKKIETVDDCFALLIRYTDDEHNGLEYDITGEIDKTVLGRAVLVEALLRVAEAILMYDNPEIICQVQQAFMKALEGDIE